MGRQKGRRDLRLTLKSGRERSVLRRHPWVFSGAVGGVAGDAEPGDTVDLLDSAGRFLARAAYSPHSQIVARIWTWDPDEEVGPDLFRRRLAQAFAARAPLISDSRTTAYRLVNAEADGLPGLVVDRYGDFLVVQCLAMGAEKWKPQLVELLATLQPCAGIYERSDVDVRAKEGLEPSTGALSGETPPDLIEVLENGYRFLVDLKRGHKTGFYLDQRDNRRAIEAATRTLSGAEVLNLFAYTGGMAVYALAGGARRATNVEDSEEALRLARRHLELNGFEPERGEHVAGDAFRVLREFRDAGRKFDFVILDPPKFAHSAADVSRAARGYKDINLLALKLLRRGGLLATFSCSGLVSADLFQKILFGAALDARREVQIIRRLSQACDHPVLITFPESEYLKGFLCRVG